MRPLIVAMLLGGVLLIAAAPSVAADNASCAAQFTRVGAQDVVPFGANIVAPEAQNPTLGGPNLGLEVKVLFAGADQTACPVSPP